MQQKVGEEYEDKAIGSDSEDDEGSRCEFEVQMSMLPSYTHYEGGESRNETVMDVQQRQPAVAFADDPILAHETASRKTVEDRRRTKTALEVHFGEEKEEDEEEQEDNTGSYGGNKAESSEDFAASTTEVESLVYLCTDKEECLPDGAWEKSEGKARVDFPLGPGLFEVRSALKALDEINKMAMPILFMCKSATRAGAMASVFQGCRSGWSADQTMAWATSFNLKFLSSGPMLNWVDACVTSRKPKGDLIFRQLFEKESSTFTYILGDVNTKEGIIIDPVDVTAERDAEMASQMGLRLTLLVNTHVHADHITGTAKLKKIVPGSRSVLSEASGGAADVKISEGDKIQFGSRFIEARATPGHTAGCMTFVMDDKSACFTGDALLIRGCGRTDFQGGSSETLYSSVHKKIFTLPNDCAVYPAHDYKGRHSSTVGEEKEFNPRLTKGLEEFTSIMDNLGLAYPKKMDVAVPANMVCGICDDA